MTNDRIQIADHRLQANLQAYLRTPAAEKAFEHFEVSWSMCAVAAVLLMVMGCCMLPTIVWTLAGLQALWSVVTLQPFAILKDNPRSNPERLIAIIGHCVIIGPDRKHALVLGTFRPTSEYSVDWLATLATSLGNLYCAPAPPPEARPLWELLHDDMYRPDRRRRVPERDSQGVELYLFDVELDLDEGRMSPLESVVTALVAQPGEAGSVMQIPWAVTAGAVQMA